MGEIFGYERKIALCRELTKLNEEVIRTTLGDAIKLYSEKEPRGEYVLVLEGCDENHIATADAEQLEPKEQVEKYILGGMAKMDAIKLVAKERGVHKSEIYNLFVEDKK